MRRRNLIIGMLAGILLFAQNGFTAQISTDLAGKIAGNFLGHIRSTHTIGSTETVIQSGQQVGHLFKLFPRGYILIAGDTIRVPVKAYSLTSTFSDLPEAYVQNILRELEIPLMVMKNTQPEKTNAPYWDYLTQFTAPGFITYSYTPDTFFLTTQWNQVYPYNKLNPTVGDDLTLTGCTQTAMAQIMRYHSHPAAGSGVFTHAWNDQSLLAIMNRPFNWEMMPNSVNGSVPEYQQDEVAALMRDLGILNQANFGVSSTSASFHTSDFERAFGYGPIAAMGIIDENFFPTIRDEIDNFRPVLLSMPGHMTVADGYSSDETGRQIHVNLGWGGAYDDYYFLDQTNIIGPYTFEPGHSIYYGIRPCEGDECNPYNPSGGGNPPVIASVLDNMVFAGPKTIRVEAYDPDGDTVTLSALSSCSALETNLNGNLLTLTPNCPDIFCRVAVTAQSHDGSVLKSFNVLCLDEMIYLGNDYDIGGQFADQDEVDEYKAYLGGDITISGGRGYSNQAFYIWVKDANGDVVVAADDKPVSGNLTPGFYTIAASLVYNYSYYQYNPNMSSYILSIACGGPDYSVADLAADLGIDLSICQTTINKDGDGNGTVSSSPAGIDCGTDCLEMYPCGAAVTLTATPDAASIFSGWSGDCSGKDLEVSIMVAGDMDCTATFYADGDQDGMPDAWEAMYGLDTQVNDADEDPDRDGYSNLDEYEIGSNPNNRNDPKPQFMPWLPILLE